MNTSFIQALIHALGFALFHFLWQGAALALPAAASRNLPARLRYGVACAAFFAMPIAFLATVAAGLPGHYPRLPLPAGFAFGPALADAGAGQGIWRTSWMQALMSGFVPFWSAGVAIFWLRSIGSWTAVWRVRLSGTDTISESWKRRARELARSMRIRPGVTLLESKLVDAPAAAGFFRPVILLPAGLLTGMPAAQIEYLLMHELAHIRRLDYAVNLLQRVVEGLLFYHPAVWWVSGILREERENCCDDAVLATAALSDARGYASALVAVEQNRWTAAQSASGGNLPVRIRRVLGAGKRRDASAGPLLAGILLLISGALLLHGFQKSSSAPAPPWQHWLDEDVAYIISPQERATFLSLSTDLEKERFVEQFWERRDPTPGTSLNQYKKEHYRRIAFANAHFADAGAGWKSDRGHAYIVFGPPDEIDSHFCQTGAPAREDWTYRSIEGIGNNVILRFSDAACSGQYTLENSGAYRLAPH